MNSTARRVTPSGGLRAVGNGSVDSGGGEAGERGAGRADLDKDGNGDGSVAKVEGGPCHTSFRPIGRWRQLGVWYAAASAARELKPQGKP
jgi:hypothetical protein